MRPSFDAKSWASCSETWRWETNSVVISEGFINLSLVLNEACLVYGELFLPTGCSFFCLTNGEGSRSSSNESIFDLSCFSELRFSRSNLLTFGGDGSLTSCSVRESDFSTDETFIVAWLFLHNLELSLYTCMGLFLFDLDFCVTFESIAFDFIVNEFRSAFTFLLLTCW